MVAPEAISEPSDGGLGKFQGQPKQASTSLPNAVFTPMSGPSATLQSPMNSFQSHSMTPTIGRPF